MGLKNQALHVMLANPHLSPFDVIERPTERYDWMLIDHLIMRFKVKASDYVEGDRLASIENMARTLAEHYNRDRWTSECLILVKDGRGAQKPAVRETRDRYPLAPHLDFCRRNADAIDYLTLKLLRDTNVAKKAVFLVTGRDWGSSRDILCESNNEDVVLHLKNEVDGIGTVARPPGVHGAYVASFANRPLEGHLVFLDGACRKSSSTEADTLMVELANALPGTVLVCTADSDVIAVLTACGREGLTLRLANTSYDSNRPMHSSAFGDLLAEAPTVGGLRTTDADFEARRPRFRTLYDIAEDDDHLGEEELELLHGEWESLVADKDQDSTLPQRLARYFYLSGIRGSVYGEFLTRVFKLNATDKAEVARKILARLAVVGPRGLKSKSAFVDTFEMLPACHDAVASEGSAVNNKRCGGELTAEDDACVASSKRLLERMNKLSKLYMEGKVPRFSHGRYLRLTKMGSHLYVRVKQDVAKYRRLKHKLLVLLILFGTDYTRTFRGLGPKGLLKVGANDRFASWCDDLKAAWDNEDRAASLEQYHVLYKTLAFMAKIPDKTQASWTPTRSSLTFRTMKYVYDLWSLTHPKGSEAYGFRVDENSVMTFAETA